MTTPATIYVSSIHLPAALTAVGTSREFIRQTLQLWQLSDHIDAAELIVSELATNAVKETSGADPSLKRDTARAHSVIGVQVRLVDASLYVEVWDRGSGSPQIPEQSLDAEGGRGLFLVESLSKQWDIHRPAVGGKVVWAELLLSEPVNPPLLDEHLPLRDPRSHAPVAGPELELAHMALMQRVSDGVRLAHQHGTQALAV